MGLKRFGHHVCKHIFPFEGVSVFSYWKSYVIGYGHDVMIIEMYTVLFHIGVPIDLVSLFSPQNAPD